METAETGEKWLFGNASGWKGAGSGQVNNSTLLLVGIFQSRAVAGREDANGGGGAAVVSARGELEVCVGSKNPQGSR